jgi:tRNA(Ile)-lysidine synthase
VHALAQGLLLHLRREELLTPGDRVGLAVSGGIDSVALLRLLLELRPELGILLSVVHFNHKLRGAESDADQEFVSQLARAHNLEFYCESRDTAQLAHEEHQGIEAAARELRYEFFWDLLHGNSPKKSLFLNKIATGHTLDDQAETVLMRLIRGTGPRGLGGIHARIVADDGYDDNDSRGEIVRPLLGIRRRQLQQYLTDGNQTWREDTTNTDSKFTRNRVRKLLLPLIEREFNPSIVGNLSELAAIARDEEDYWENEIAGWMGTVVQWSQPQWTSGLPGFDDLRTLVQIQTPHAHPRNPEQNNAELAQRIEHSTHAIANCTVSRRWLATEPKAVQRRVIKAIGEQAGISLAFKHVEEILRFAAEGGSAGKELSLPRDWKVVREAEAIVFVTPDLRREEPVSDYEYSLSVPGRVLIPELALVVEALRVSPHASDAEYNPQQLLDAKRLPEGILVRNWRPGDRYWPAHTKAPKKIKELLQEKHVPQPERKRWPVVVSGHEIVWLRGFALPAKFRWKRDGDAILIRETPWLER